MATTWYKADWRKLRGGERCRVKALNGDDAVGVRLMEMGLVPGSEFVYRGKAPLGDPLLIEIFGGDLSLRLVEAERAEIESQEPPPVQ